MRKQLIAAAFASLVASDPALGAEEIEIPKEHWHFSGPFGAFDRASVQRGLQVYREVCQTCHSLKLVAFRDLAALGYNEEEIKAIAEAYTLTDGPDSDGEMFERPGMPADRFPPPFPNDNAAAAANGGAVPPDLSLMAKAREGGPDYIQAILTGYEEPPQGVELQPGQNYNKYFAGHVIAMPPPLSEGMVTYADGTEASVDQMAHDVSAFLMWAADPKLEQRKQTGIKVLLFLLVFTGLLYAVKRKVWADLH